MQLQTSFSTDVRCFALSRTSTGMKTEYAVVWGDPFDGESRDGGRAAFQNRLRWQACVREEHQRAPLNYEDSMKGNCDVKIFWLAI